MGAVTVGLDIGTTAVKALAVDDGGAVVASARRPHRLLCGPDQLAHVADDAWRAGVTTAYDDVAAGLDVAAVAVTAMVPSLTAVDGRGRPCAPGLLYGDARGSGTPGLSPAESGEAAGFLRWLADDCPEAAGFWPAQAVANHALCGRAAVDYPTAFCLSPLFDGTTWSPLAADLGARPEQLPAVVADVTEPIGRIGNDGPLVGAGTVDALAAQYVAGADEPGDVLVLLGATLIVWVTTPGWIERPGLWSVPHTAPGLAAVGGPSNAGGLFVDWATALVGAPTENAPGAAFGQGPVSGDGAGEAQVLEPGDVPVWLPYARGERVPLHRGDLRAEIAGLHLGHGRAELVRAAYEASAFVVRHIIDLSGQPARRIVAVGGGVRRPGWIAALADCTGLPVDVAAVPDASALGAAFLARCVAGMEKVPTDARRWARTSHRVEPDPAWSAACAARYARFRARTEMAG